MAAPDQFANLFASSEPKDDLRLLVLVSGLQCPASRLIQVTIRNIGCLVVRHFPIPPLVFFFVVTMYINHGKEKNNNEDDNENDCHWLVRPNLSKKNQRILNPP